MIASYVNGTLKAKDTAVVEEIVGSSTVYKYFYDRKVQEREFLLQMIPQERLSHTEKESLVAELRSINQDLMEADVETWKDQVQSFLKKPFFTIRY